VTPTRWLLLSFLVLIAVGTLALKLPGMSTGAPLSWVDALFMATSAVCVTGLTTVSVQFDLSPAGQLLILLLIQLGGIGIVTLASVLIFSVHKRLPLEYQEMLSSTVAAGRRVAVREVAVVVVRYTLVLELAGFVLLMVFWPPTTSLGERLWLCLFHTVSAFCNAGFSLYHDSLERLADAPGVNIVIMGLIVLGGFGFVNLQELWLRLRAGTLQWRRCSLFMKTSLVFTVLLIALGALSLLALERWVAFAGRGAGEALLAALFQSVTTRTAGFNTVPVVDFTDLSLFLMMILMFIGGVSGSCAGGVKLGALTVLVAMLRSYLRNHRDPLLFQRRIPAPIQRRALVLIFASLLAVAGGVILLYLCEARLVSFRDTMGSEFLAYLFEVVSALGTVGLSTGLTPELSPHSKLLLVTLMFTGRLGPLVMIAAWVDTGAPRPFTQPEEALPVG